MWQRLCGPWHYIVLCRLKSTDIKKLLQIFDLKDIIIYLCSLNTESMRTFLLTISLLISSLAFAQVPSVKVENAKGESFDTKTLMQAGKPMIISFWSTSCKPCIRELDAVYDALPDWKDEADFNVVAVSTDDSRLLAKARSFAEGRGWGEDYILLFDKNQDFMRAMNVSQVPHVFVLDAKGRIVYSHTSYLPGNEVELFEAIKKCK